MCLGISDCISSMDRGMKVWWLTETRCREEVNMRPGLPQVRERQRNSDLKMNFCTAWPYRPPGANLTSSQDHSHSSVKENEMIEAVQTDSPERM